MAHQILSMLLADDYSCYLAPYGSGVSLMMMIHTTNSAYHTEGDGSP